MQENKQRCHLCGNHCPVENLKCNKRKKYFKQLLNKERIGASMRDNQEENRNDFVKEENNEGYQKKDNHEEDSHEKNHHGDCNGHTGQGLHGRHKRKDHGEMLSRYINKDDLQSLLVQSGHFLNFKKNGKRGQRKILRILAEHTDVSQKELQDLLGIESGSMSEIVSKLEHKGLIKREKDKLDRRMSRIKITKNGLELAKEIEAIDVVDEESLFTSLSVEEQEQLKTILKKLLQGWEKIE